MSEAHAPPMTFSPESLMDDRVKTGPLLVFWGQEEWVDAGRELDHGEPPKRTWRHRLFGMKAWRLDIRLAPPDGTELEPWGVAIAKRLGLPWLPPRPGDKAVWLPGGVMARNASQALGSTSKVFGRLGGFELCGAQVRVERWDAGRLSEHPGKPAAGHDQRSCQPKEGSGHGEVPGV